jgi:AcrR family transcriptional regulator
MDAIGDAIGYSKGTVYLHYRSREDVLAALAVQSGRKRTELFERAAAFRGRPRERMAAVGEAYAKFVREYPHHFRVEQEIHSSQVRAKAADERRAQIEACDDAGRAIVWGLIRDGIAQGDLVLPPGMQVVDVGFSLWAITFGAFFLMSSGIDLESRGLADPHATVRRACNAYLDGVGWRPLWSEWDYPATYARIQKEVFPRGA